MLKEEKTILYIDDEIENLEGFEFTFMTKYRIFTSQTADDAFKILENNIIKVIICDQRMPDISGVELLNIIKEKYPDSVRIILTAYADLENAIDAINKGEIFRYLSKPWNKVDLQATIENALENYDLKIQNKKLLNELKSRNVELVKINNQIQNKNIELKQKNEEYYTLNEVYMSQNEALKNALQKAEEGEVLKNKFLTNLSHEIRTPMNGIIGFASLLNEKDLSEEKRKYFTSIIINSSNQLLRIIDDLVEISRLETKQVKVIKNDVCLNNLFLELLSIYDIKAKENKTPLYINKVLNDIESTIITDEAKLRKILTNLLDNALRYTNKGFIELGYKVEENNIIVYVKDTGIGISEEMIEKIFDRFSQEDAEYSIKTGGLGLGLSIAKENSELIGGNLTVESVKHQGSTFYLKLPYPAKKILFDYNQTDEKLKTACDILVAEDEEINYIFIETLLQKSKLNLKIIHAKNGREAVEIFKENTKIKLILMDLKMPKLSGIDATREIRKIDKDIPIIAQTAYNESEEVHTALNAGCNDSISKPIDSNLLISLIKKYLKL